jgi:phage terminase small subunit
MAERLTQKQQLWAEYNIITHNQTMAARFAGYKGDDNVLAVIGSRNARNPKIVRYMEKRMKALTMSADEVLYRLTQQAQASVADFIVPISPGMFTFDIDKIIEKGHLVKKLRYTKGVGIDLEVNDPQAALRMLGKYHKLFTQRVEIDWRVKIVEGLVQGEITRENVIEELGNDLATELFNSAGIFISESGEVKATGGGSKALAVAAANRDTSGRGSERAAARSTVSSRLLSQTTDNEAEETTGEDDG